MLSETIERLVRRTRGAYPHKTILSRAERSETNCFVRRVPFLFLFALPGKCVFDDSKHSIWSPRLNHEFRGRTLRIRERTNGRNPTQTGARQFATANRFEKSRNRIEKLFECQFQKLGRKLKGFNSWKQCPEETLNSNQLQNFRKQKN